MKKLFLMLGVVSLCTCGLMAGVGMASDGKGDATAFTGKITAVEADRNSFTVESSTGIVHMFAVSAEQKGKLSVGQNVTVSYVNQYAWPLPTKEITILQN